MAQKLAGSRTGYFKSGAQHDLGPCGCRNKFRFSMGQSRCRWNPSTPWHIRPHANWPSMEAQPFQDAHEAGRTAAVGEEGCLPNAIFSSFVMTASHLLHCGKVTLTRCRSSGLVKLVSRSSLSRYIMYRGRVGIEHICRLSWSVTVL